MILRGKNGSSSNVTLTVLHYFTSCFQFMGSLVYPLKALIEVLEFRIWLNRRFGKITHFKNREKLLNALIENSNHDDSKTGGRGVLYVEFGVAFGETSRYLISGTKVPLVYHGFDTFEGLPKAWRGLPAGAMSSNGQIPNILGENIYFHKGLIQDTITQVNFQSALKKIFIFDLDLFEPTLFALNHVFSEIKEGDIVYFDEAFDSDERVIVENYFLDEFEFEVIGASPFGLAFQIISSKV
jgi:hypothetical protein